MVLSAQAPAHRPAPRRGPRPPSPSAAVPSRSRRQARRRALNAATERELLNRYCVACHSERAKAAGHGFGAQAALDALDLDDVHTHAEKLELVVRKLRAGMMPPAGMRAARARRLQVDDRRGSRTSSTATATPYTPPPGLHRLNRTEYANVDPRPARSRHRSRRSTCRPTTRRTASTTSPARSGISSTLVEAYVSAAEKISRLAIGEPDAADARRLPHAGRHVAGLSHRRAAVRHARRHARARTCFRPTANTP